MMKVNTPLVQMKILVNGRPIQEYHKDQKVFVEGKRGSNFELSLRNLSARRILVHPTVDGLSVMTGKEASRNDHSEGYVLGPYQEMTVPGWRLDNDSVAKFFFAGGGKSYAEKTGRPLNKGVIAAAVWEAKQVEWFFHEMPSKVIANPQGISFGSSGTTNIYSNPNDQTAAADCYYMDTLSYAGDSVSHGEKCGARNRGEEKCSGKITLESANVNNLGTGFGKQADHQVYTTQFTPERDEPNAIAVIYYDDVRGLRKRGIRVNKHCNQAGPNLPDPFPKDSGCKPPHGWNG